MTFRFSIFSKLLIFILPLVCLPIAILGYFSIQAAEERVNRLVRHEQMIKVEGSADKIKNIFYQLPHRSGDHRQPAAS